MFILLCMNSIVVGGVVFERVFGVIPKGSGLPLSFQRLRALVFDNAFCRRSEFLFYVLISEEEWKTFARAEMRVV